MERKISHDKLKEIELYLVGDGEFEGVKQSHEYLVWCISHIEHLKQVGLRIVLDKAHIMAERNRYKKRLSKSIAALYQIANGDGVYGQQAGEYKAIARTAIAEAESDE